MTYKININNPTLWLFAIITLHLFLLLNFKFTLWPEMVVYPYLLNNGFSLYKDVINPYPPIFPLFLAIFSKIFGYSPAPYQILTWVVIITTDYLVYRLSYKITHSFKSAFLSIIFFVFFSIPFGINGLWFDLVQLPLILGSLYFFYEYINFLKLSSLTRAFILSIAAFFIKQQVLSLLTVIIVVLIITKKISKGETIKTLYNVILFFAFLIFLHLVIFYKLGNLNDFIFWTAVFPFTKASNMPGYVSLASFRQLSIVLALFASFSPLIFSKVRKSLKLIIFTALTITSFTYPRFDYFHLIPALALLSLVAGQNISFFNKSSMSIKFITILAFLYLSAFSFRAYYKDFRQEVRFFDKDIFLAAQKLESLTPKSQLVYMQNSQDQLLPLAQRLPPKPWADEFPWYMEIVGVQEKVIEQLELSKPNFIVYQPYSKGQKYNLGVYKPQKLSDYLDKNYQNFVNLSDNLVLKTRK